MIQFVDNARLWWRKWSTWLAALNAGGWVLALLPFANFLPYGMVIPAVLAIFFVGWLLPVLVVHIKQKKLHDDC